MPNENKLVVTNVAKSFPTPGEPLVILRDVNLAMSPGDNVAIIGPSGSGKSTLLHILGTLDQPTSGNVSLLGTDPFQLSEAELARFRNANIGFIFQEHHLLPQLSVMENVLIPAMSDGTPTAALVQRASDLVTRVGLSDRTTHRPAELSGGERQRVAVARSLLMSPALVLADEPTGSLDRKTASAITDLLLELQAQEQAMLVVVTHSLDLAGRCKQRLELIEGTLRGTD